MLNTAKWIGRGLVFSRNLTDQRRLWFLQTNRLFSTNDGVPQAGHTKAEALSEVNAISNAALVDPNEDYRTQRKAIYIMPYYGASDEEIYGLSDALAKQALRTYGGLIRKSDTADEWRERLRKLTRTGNIPRQLTIRGVVVSNKMDRSVVVAAKRRVFHSKLQAHYYRTKRFMAHDGPNLCEEGDDVIIRSCRPLSKRKAHVVVINFGDKLKIGTDDRKVLLENVD